uniref:CSON013859 protein n=1 Tax=Culicoides sonorensis TaxID=179676 RepID=A0A336KNQ2_CULSO
MYNNVKLKYYLNFIPFIGKCDISNLVPVPFENNRTESTGKMYKVPVRTYYTPYSRFILHRVKEYIIKSKQIQNDSEDIHCRIKTLPSASEQL